MKAIAQMMPTTALKTVANFVGGQGDPQITEALRILGEIVGQEPTITAWDDPALRLFDQDCMVAVFPQDEVWPLRHAQASEAINAGLRELCKRRQAEFRATSHPDLFYYIRGWWPEDGLNPCWEALLDPKLQRRAARVAAECVKRHGLVPCA